MRGKQTIIQVYQFATAELTMAQRKREKEANAQVQARAHRPHMHVHTPTPPHLDVYGAAPRLCARAAHARGLLLTRAQPRLATLSCSQIPALPRLLGTPWSTTIAAPSAGYSCLLGQGCAANVTEVVVAAACGRSAGKTPLSRARRLGGHTIGARPAAVLGANDNRLGAALGGMLPHIAPEQWHVLFVAVRQAHVTAGREDQGEAVWWGSGFGPSVRFRLTRVSWSILFHRTRFTPLANSRNV